VKTLLATLINAISVAFFLIKPWLTGTEQVIHWTYGVPMILAGIAGGYLGARVVRRLDKNLVRRIIVTIGTLLVTWYFYDKYGR
jgi:uncharacterized protein